MRNQQNTFKIRQTASATERLKQAHQLMGISSRLGQEMEEIFNRWAKIRINDKEVRKLIEVAMTPSKELLLNLKEESRETLSSQYLKIVDNVLEFAFSAPSQLENTTKGTLFGAYNAVSGYFQNVRSFANDEAKLKSIINGTGFQRVQTAFNCCSDFAKNGIINFN